MIRTFAFAAATLACVSLSACGTSQTDRGLSGAGIGAATGAVIGGVTGGSVGTGAVVGAVVGGVVGATTTKDDINLGKPIWRKSCRDRQRAGERISCRKKSRR
jgi:osmotically inducible lipoprotein OsmB